MGTRLAPSRRTPLCQDPHQATGLCTHSCGRRGVVLHQIVPLLIQRIHQTKVPIPCVQHIKLKFICKVLSHNINTQLKPIYRIYSLKYRCLKMQFKMLFVNRQCDCDNLFSAQFTVILVIPPFVKDTFQIVQPQDKETRRTPPNHGGVSDRVSPGAQSRTTIFLAVVLSIFDRGN